MLDTLELLERPRGGLLNGSSRAASGRARRATPLAVVCTPDAHADDLVDRLRQEGMIVCITNDFHGCLRVVTSVAPDVVFIDPQLPRRLEQLLRAHPASSAASIRWMGEALVAQAPTVAHAKRPVVTASTPPT